MNDDHGIHGTTIDTHRVPTASERELLGEVAAQSGPRLLAVARRILQNEADAADALQDAFLSAYRGLPAFENKSAITTWLHRIVVNACLLKLRSRGRQRRLEAELSQEQKTGPTATDIPVLALVNDHPADEITRMETQTLVRRSIDQLAASHRRVLWLRDIEQLSTGETARRLGLAIGAVKTRLHRARAALKELLQRQHSFQFLT